MVQNVTSSSSDAACATAYGHLRAISRERPPPSFAERKSNLRALRRMLVTEKDAFAAAISRDFGNRSRRETLMSEVVPALQGIEDALRHLRRWMRPERTGTALHFWPASNRIISQPKGLVLIIAPWNYPLQLTIAPLVAALAAGNRVIVKPSELTPAFSDILKTRIEATIGPDHLAVVTGGVEVAAALTALPFDHILFTGSTVVGAKVMQAAARNLTPVTLELGGKSPAIIHESYDIETAARRIARGKLMNAGQTCIAPDYVLVPGALTETFMRHYEASVRRFYPRLVTNPDYTSIINDAHLTRLVRHLDDAIQKGASARVVDPSREMPESRAYSSNARKFAPVLLTGVTDEMTVMQEEIFGPILPIVGYERLEEAISYVNARPRPLALYYFDHDKQRTDHILTSTAAGGVSINDTIFHVAQESLPFGGIGASGMGAYHGEAGFKTFSHAKAVFRQSRLAGTELLNPPYGRLFDRMIATLIRRFSGLT